MCVKCILPGMLFREEKQTQENMSLPWSRLASAGASSVTVHPASLAKHPQTWSKEEVRVWLRWCAEEFSIDEVPPEKFDLNGKALCLLSRNDFIERLPSNGDVLFNCLQSLITKSSGTGLLYCSKAMGFGGETGQTYTDPRIALSPLQSDPSTTGVLIVPSTSVSAASGAMSSFNNLSPRNFVSIHAHPLFIEESHDGQNITSRQGVPKENGMDGSQEMSRHSKSDTSVTSLCHESGGTGSPISNETAPSCGEHSLSALRQHRSADCRLLWEFIYQLLLNTQYTSYVSWENVDAFVFRIVNPTGLAELWGQQKNRTNMTYEKLSRALRYYYRMNIIRKVPGKRLTYQFLQSPSCIKKGQRGAKPQCRVPDNSAGTKLQTKQTFAACDTPCSSDASSVDNASEGSEDGKREILADTSSDIRHTGGNTGIGRGSFGRHSGGVKLEDKKRNAPDFLHPLADMTQSDGYSAGLTDYAKHCIERISILEPLPTIYNQYFKQYHPSAFHPADRISPHSDIRSQPMFNPDASPGIRMKQEPNNESNRLTSSPATCSSVFRPHRFDLENQLQVPSYQHVVRTKSSSPISVFQEEPEDLSIKKEPANTNEPSPSGKTDMDASE